MYRTFLFKFAMNSSCSIASVGSIFIRNSATTVLIALSLSSTILNGQENNIKKKVNNFRYLYVQHSFHVIGKFISMNFDKFKEHIKIILVCRKTRASTIQFKYFQEY